MAVALVQNSGLLQGGSVESPSAYAFGTRPAAGNLVVDFGATLTAGGSNYATSDNCGNVWDTEDAANTFTTADIGSVNNRVAIGRAQAAATTPAGGGAYVVSGAFANWAFMTRLVAEFSGCLTSGVNVDAGKATFGNTYAFTLGLTVQTAGDFAQPGDLVVCAFAGEFPAGPDTGWQLDPAYGYTTLGRKVSAGGQMVVYGYKIVPAGAGGRQSARVQCTATASAPLLVGVIRVFGAVGRTGAPAPSPTPSPTPAPGPAPVPVPVGGDAPWAPAVVYVEDLITATQSPLPAPIHGDYGNPGFANSWPTVQAPSIRALLQSPGSSGEAPYVAVANWAQNHCDQIWPGFNVFAAEGNAYGVLGHVVVEAKLCLTQGLRIDTGTWEEIDRVWELKARQKGPPGFGYVNQGELADFAVDEAGHSVCRFMPVQGVTGFEIARRNGSATIKLTNPLNYAQFGVFGAFRLKALDATGQAMIAAGQVRILVCANWDFFASDGAPGPRGDAGIDATLGGAVLLTTADWRVAGLIGVEAFKKETGWSSTHGWQPRPIAIQWPGGTAQNPPTQAFPRPYGTMPNDEALAKPPKYVYSRTAPPPVPTPVPAPAPAGTPSGGASSAITVPSNATVAAAGGSWQQWTDSTRAEHLKLVGGSALDQSSIVGDASRRMGHNWYGYKMPSRAEVPAAIAQIKRLGLSHIRIGPIDDWLNAGADSVYPAGADAYGCHYNASTRDALWYFLASLSQAGITYHLMTFLTWGAMRSGISNRWPDESDATLSTPLLAQLGQADHVRHWKNCVDALYSQPVSYLGGKTILQDSACAVFETVNEGNLGATEWGFYATGQLNRATAIQPYFNAWQVANLGSVVYNYLPFGGGAGSTQYGRFILDTMTSAHTWMRQYVRDRGFVNLATGNNFLPNLLDAVLRAKVFDATDMHAYADLSDVGDQFANRSMIGDRLLWLGNPAATMIHGKPVVFSEFSFGSANEFGYELFLFYAIAALQGWSYTSQFSRMAETFNQADGSVWPGNFEVWVSHGHDSTKDFVHWAGRLIGTFLFARRDVTESTSEVGLVLREQFIRNSSKPWAESWPMPIRQLAMLRKVRALNEAHVNGSLGWIGPGAAPAEIRDPLNVSADYGRSIDDWITLWKGSGALPSGNLSNGATGVFQSDTGEILINVSTRAARVQTARSHVLCWDAKSGIVNSSAVTIEDATPKAALAVIDNASAAATVQTTNRILVVLAGAARGTSSGAAAAITANGTLWWDQIGASVTAYKVGASGNKSTSLPMWSRGTIVVARLALASGSWTCYRLDQSGNRVGQVPTQRLTDGTVRIVFDNTGTGVSQQTFAFDLVNDQAIAPTPAPGPAPAPSPAPSGVTAVWYSSVASAAAGANPTVSATLPSPIAADSLVLGLSAAFAGGGGAAVTASDSSSVTWAKREVFANYTGGTQTKQETGQHYKLVANAISSALTAAFSVTSGYSSLYGQWAVFSNIDTVLGLVAHGSAIGGGAASGITVATDTNLSRVPKAGDLVVTKITAESYAGGSAAVAFALAGAGWTIKTIRTDDSGTPPRAAWAWKIATTDGAQSAAWSSTPGFTDGIVGATITVFAAKAVAVAPPATPPSPTAAPVFVLASSVPVTVGSVLGRRQPRLYGVAFNVEPMCIDTGRLIYKISDTALTAVNSVYDRGVALTYGGSYASQAELLGTAPAAGAFRFWAAGGVIRLGSSPAGIVTSDVVRDAPYTGSAQVALRHSVPFLLRQIVQEAIPSAVVSEADVMALAQLAPGAAGLWIDDDTTAIQAMDRLAESIGAWYGFDPVGVLRMGRMEAPAATADAEIDDSQILAIERLPMRDNVRGRPVWQVRLHYLFNHTVQAEVAGSVGLEARADFGREYRRTVVASDSTVRQAYRLAEVLDRYTLLVPPATTGQPAADEAMRLLTLYKVPRRMWSVRVKLQPEDLGRLRLGSTVRLTHRRLGLSAGTNALLIGMTREFSSRVAVLKLWG
jgi:hypothetical protein